MTLASIENPSRTAHSAKTDFSETKNASSARTENSEFGQVMSEAMQQPHETPGTAAGQEMAANPVVLPGMPSALGAFGPLGGDFLKAVHLGPHMNVITSEAAVPDEQSLEAFARSQGLDETAVQWLMGTSPAVTAMPPTGAVETATPADSAALLGVGSASNAANSSDEVNTLDVSSGAVAANPAAPSPADASAKGNKPDMPILPNALNAAALWAMTQATEKARVTTAAAEDPTDAAKVQINLLASPAPAAFWMLRNPLVAAPAKEPVTTPSGIALSEIDLTQAATPELLESLGQSLAEGGNAVTAGEHPTPLSGHSGQHGHRLDAAAAARQDAQNPDASAAAPDSGNALRSENVQNLAEKMGQAVGQRILSEIEKGQWHLKLSLRPATLGHIEVEMRMRSGELDAVFTAPQAVTRELLQEGMSKLKDTLNQMGMDVASMQVGDGQTQKRGGESTPGQLSKSTDIDADDSKSGLSNAQTPVSRMKMGQDGWDVLV